VAKLEQLLSAVSDSELKAELEAEVASLKGRMRFGLVYERHLPETVIVGDVDGLKVGDHVRPRQEASNGHDYRVVGLKGSKATVIGVNGASTNGDTIELPLDDLLAVKPFGVDIIARPRPSPARLCRSHELKRPPMSVLVSILACHELIKLSRHERTD